VGLGLCNRELCALSSSMTKKSLGNSKSFHDLHFFSETTLNFLFGNALQFLVEEMILSSIFWAKQL